jgi:hypothetical protein
MKLITMTSEVGYVYICIKTYRKNLIYYILFIIYIYLYIIFIFIYIFIIFIIFYL